MLVIEKQLSGSQQSLSLKKQAFVSNPSESSSSSGGSGQNTSEQELDIDDENTEGRAAASRSTSQFSEPIVQEFEDDELIVDKQSTNAEQWNEKERDIE